MAEDSDWTREVPPAGGGVSPLRFPYVWLHDAKVDFTNTDLVKTIVPSKALVLVYGPSGDGKTFWTIDLACHIGMGEEWCHRRVRRGLVVYVAAEAGTSILKRFVARRGDDCEDPWVAIITRGANLLHPGEVELLIGDIQAIADQTPHDVSMVIFDTFSRSTPGGDENAAQDITRAVESADRIRDKLGATTVFVHHTGKDASRGARGHSALFAAADTVISVVDKVATLEKSRDGQTGEQFPFALKVVELGEDSDGEPVTTCIVEHTSVAPTPKRKPLPAGSTTAFSALQESIQTQGVQLPGTSTIPAGVRGVVLGQWRDQFKLRYGNDDPDASRKAFQRARHELLRLKYIAISDPYVWVL